MFNFQFCENKFDISGVILLFALQLHNKAFCDCFNNYGKIRMQTHLRNFQVGSGLKDGDLMVYRCSLS